MGKKRNHEAEEEAQPRSNKEAKKTRTANFSELSLDTLLEREVELANEVRQKQQELTDARRLKPLLYGNNEARQMNTRRLRAEYAHAEVKREIERRFKAMEEAGETPGGRRRQQRPGEGSGAGAEDRGPSHPPAAAGTPAPPPPPRRQGMMTGNVVLPPQQQQQQMGVGMMGQPMMQMGGFGTAGAFRPMGTTGGCGGTALPGMAGLGGLGCGGGCLGTGGCMGGCLGGVPCMGGLGGMPGMGGMSGLGGLGGAGTAFPPS